MATAFTPWTATQVAQDLMQGIQAATPQLTDFTEGSVLRAILETWAIEAEQLGQQVLSGIDATIETLILRMLQLQPQPAQAAYTTVQFSVLTAPSSAVTLPQGFQVGVPNSTLAYALGAPVQWPAGQTTLEAVVTCQTPGSVGNVPANTITQILSPVPSGLTGLSVTNPQAVITGQDAQTLLDAMAQVPAALARLKKGTAQAVAAAALTATVQDASGYVTEAVGAAVSQTGGYVSAPATAPVLTAVSPSPATNLAAGTYTVAYTFTTSNGETPPSPTATVTISAGQAIQVAAIPLPGPGSSPPSPQATGVNYYLSTAAGSTTLAYAASGTGGSVTLSSLPASGAASPPTTNTAFNGTPGFATVWVANTANTAPSSALLQAVQNQVVGYVDSTGTVHEGAIADGILAQIVAAQLATQNVTVAILPQPGYTLSMLQSAIASAIAAYFAGLDIGQGITWTDLLRAILAVPGVADAQLTQPSGNVAGVLGQRWILGTVSLNALS